MKIAGRHSMTCVIREILVELHRVQKEKETYIFAEFHGWNAVSQQTSDLDIAFIHDHVMARLHTRCTNKHHKHRHVHGAPINTTNTDVYTVHQ